VRFLITLLVQEFSRPSRPDPLAWIVPAEPVLTESQTYELLDQMDGDLFREVRRGPLPLGTASRDTAEVFAHLAPRRRRTRRWFR
jgi:hypothetical protein